MSEHKDCHDYFAMISEFIDGELPEELCNVLQEHLEGCDNCTVVYNTMKRTIEIYREEEGEPQLPEGVKTRLFTTLALDEYLHK